MYSVKPFQITPPRPRRDESTTWQIICPLCFCTHTHGAGGRGTVVPHCYSPNVLRDPEAELYELLDPAEVGLAKKPEGLERARKSALAANRRAGKCASKARTYVTRVRETERGTYPKSKRDVINAALWKRKAASARAYAQSRLDSLVKLVEEAQ